MTDIAAARRAIRLYRRVSLVLLWGVALMLAALLALPGLAASAEPLGGRTLEQRFTNGGDSWVEALFTMPLPAGTRWHVIRLWIDDDGTHEAVRSALAPAQDGLLTVGTPPIPPGAALVVTVDLADLGLAQDGAATGGMAIDLATGLPLAEPALDPIPGAD